MKSIVARYDHVAVGQCQSNELAISTLTIRHYATGQGVPSKRPAASAFDVKNPVGVGVDSLDRELVHVVYIVPITTENGKCRPTPPAKPRETTTLPFIFGGIPSAPLTVLWMYRRGPVKPAASTV